MQAFRAEEASSKSLQPDSPRLCQLSSAASHVIAHSTSTRASKPKPAETTILSERDGAAVRELFEHMDRDGDGTLSVAELAAMLAELGEARPEAQARRLAAELASAPGREDRITFDDLRGFQAAAARRAAGAPQPG